MKSMFVIIKGKAILLIMSLTLNTEWVYFNSLSHLKLYLWKKTLQSVFHFLE